MPLVENLKRIREPINARFLKNDNCLPLVEDRLARWAEAKKDGKLTAMWFCDDARLIATSAFDTFDILPIRTIAAAGSPEPFQHEINHSSIGQGVVLGHYDSSLQQPGKPLSGCGGLGVKEKRKDIINKGKVREAVGYVDYQIESYDVVYQTLKTAWKVAQTSNTGKPVLTCLWDHTTYQMIPIGYFDEKKKYEGIIPFEELTSEQKKIITLDDLREIDRSNLSAPLQELLSRNAEVVGKASQQVDQFAQFKESQKVQDPPLVMITTSPIPFGARYPSLHRPNTVFKVSLPFQKTPDYTIDGSFVFPEEEIKNVIAQAHYPLSHALTAKRGGNFYSTKTLLIETPSIDASYYVLGELKKLAWFREWEAQGGKVITAEIKSGRVLRIQDVE